MGRIVYGPYSYGATSYCGPNLLFSLVPDLNVSSCMLSSETFGVDGVSIARVWASRYSN